MNTLKPSIGLAKSFSVEKPFVADMYSSVASDLAPDKIGSSDKFSLLLHLVRTPVRYTKEMQLEGDLLESWQIKNDERFFLLRLRKNQLFSNGTEILAKHLKETLEWQMSKGVAIHFDFKKISSVKVSGDYDLEIETSVPARDFIRQLAHPEFGVYYSLKTTMNGKDFIITSGPYVVEKLFEDNSLLLKKNKNYPSKITFPSFVKWVSTSADRQLDGLISGTIDFSVPNQLFGASEHKKIEQSAKALKAIDSNMGYTFFLSLNAESKEFSTVEKRKAFLKRMQKLKIDFTDLNPLWTFANQLFLEGGFGRPSQSEIKKVWEEIGAEATPFDAKKLSLLVSSRFNFTNELVSFLKLQKIDLEITKYTNFDEYAKLVNEKKFDLIQVNNDFSAIELLENLLVTFRESRPLVFPKGKSFRTLLERAESAATIEEKSKIVKEIGIRLLGEGLVFPLAHYKKFAYSKKEYSFSHWSSLFPDMRIYKIDVGDENLPR